MPDDSYEKAAWAKDKVLLAIDEVAMGNFLGSMFVAGTVFPKDFNFSVLPGLTDSKKVSDRRRFELEKLIKINAEWWFCEEIDHETIDRESAYHSRFRVAAKVINSDKNPYDIADVLMDGNVKLSNLKDGFESEFLVKGDLHCYSIAAASIIAKCHQRRHIIELAKLYPEYDLENNSGYGTAKHQAAILKFGLTPHHRRTYCKRFI